MDLNTLETILAEIKIVRNSEYYESDNDRLIAIEERLTYQVIDEKNRLQGRWKHGS